MGGVIKRLRVLSLEALGGHSGVGGRGTTEKEAVMALATVGCLSVALEPGKEEVCLEPLSYLPSSGGW